MIVTLYSGHIQGGPNVTEGTAPAVLDRDVLLVYVGTFNSMDGEVKITRQHIDKLAANHNARLDKLTIDGTETPMRDLPPIQVDHTSSAHDTVGRVVSRLTVKDHPIEGVMTPCLFGKARFLGQENCEKANDGRWTNVSIGADLEAGVLKELSVTPFPAAPHASLLSSKGPSMAFPDEMKKRCKKYLTEEKKMSDEDADKKLAALSDEDGKKLSDEVDEHDKKMAAEDDEKKKLAADEEEKKKDLAADEDDKDDKEKKLSAKKKKITALMASANDAVRLAKLEARRGTVTIKLSRLRSEQRITPAEEKTLNDLKLAERSDEALELAWKILETREPVIHAGQFGSVKVVDLASAGEAMKRARLSSEETSVLSNMPFTRKMIEATNGGKETTALSDQAPAPVRMSEPEPTTTVDHDAQQQRIQTLEAQVTKLAGTLEALSELVA